MLNNQTVDFVTIVFNNKIEIDLLKIQALSFKYVDPNMVGRIVIIYNDANPGNNINLLKELLCQYYPSNFIRNLLFISSLDVGMTDVSSDWFSQQVLKIIVSKKLSSDFYIVLDAKNHFIKNVSYNFFFNNESKAYLNTTEHGLPMLDYYNNCLNFFSIPDPSNSTYKIQTVTPFPMSVDSCMGLISFVEEKYCKNFEQYFMSSKRLTEFFLYYSYLVYSGDINKYVFASVPRFNYLGRVDPKTVDYNTPASKKLLLDQFPSISVFGLHRGFIEFLNDELKLQLFDLYQKFFNDDKVKQILIDIFDSTELEYYFYDQIPIDFSADIYKSKNPDLSHLTDKKAMLHYLHQGINEGRIYK